MACDITATCAGFVSAIEAEPGPAEAARVAQLAEAEPLLDLINAYPGVTVVQGGDTLPVLSSLVQRITAARFGVGIAEWRYWEQSSPGADELTLPAAAAYAAVDLNGVRLAPTVDYSIAGATLTLTYPLERGNLLTVRSYGAPT